MRKSTEKEEDISQGKEKKSSLHKREYIIEEMKEESKLTEKNYEKKEKHNDQLLDNSRQSISTQAYTLLEVC